MSRLANFNRARRAYMASPTQQNLRVFLRLKARLGRFDERMMSRRFTGNARDLSPHVCPAAKRATVRAVAAMLVPTDTLRPPGSSSSNHALRNGAGQGLAVDFGNYPGYRPGEPGWPKGKERLETFQRKELWRWKAGRLQGLVELIGPHNARNVLRGHQTNLVEGTALEDMHDNHVHEGFSR